MNFIHKVKKDGQLVDINTLPEKDQEKIKADLSQKLADKIATIMARR